MSITSADDDVATMTEEEATLIARQVFSRCRLNRWEGLFTMLQESAQLASMKMVMDNHIHTTLLHQAITSKGDSMERARVIKEILRQHPGASRVKNGYGSLPLHVILQRSAKMPSSTKEEVIRLLIDAYPEGLMEPASLGGRTPVHMVFTDYIGIVSVHLVRHMLTIGEPACSLLDRKGWLPIHVACSHHTSVQKLGMLLDAYPPGLWVRTYDGETIHDLAKSTATKAHPNYRLTSEIQALMKNSMMTSGQFSFSTSKRPTINKNTTATIVSAVSSGDDEDCPPASKRPCLRYSPEQDPAKLLLNLSRSVPANTARTTHRNRMYDEPDHHSSAYMYHTPYPSSWYRQSSWTYYDHYPPPSSQSSEYHRRHRFVDPYYCRDSSPYNHHRHTYHHASDHRFHDKRSHQYETPDNYDDYDAPTYSYKRRVCHQHRSPVKPKATIDLSNEDDSDEDTSQV